MEVKPGYKQTELGVIPEEWEVCRLGEAAEFLDGRRHPVKDSDRAKMRGLIPYYGASGIVDHVNDYLFDDDLILLGEDGENILSRNCRLAFRISGKAWVNNHAHVLKPKPGFEIGFLTEFLESLQYDQYNTGTAQPKLNKHVCSGIPILRPPHVEQCAIAAVLGDVDALLGALEKLNAKKRDLKQAAMQQLLTGRKRLPGFNGDWETSTVGCEFEIRLGKMLDVEKNSGALKPYLGNRAVQWGRIHVESLSTVAMTRTDLERYRLLRGDLLVCEGGEVGRAAIWEAPIDECYYQKALHRLRPLRGFHSQLMVELLRFWSEQGMLTNYVTQTSIAHLTREKFAEVPMPVPPLPEQTAIAVVLSDMDAEIAALEARLAKTRSLKQGMMQELLTGKTRLI